MTKSRQKSNQKAQLQDFRLKRLGKKKKKNNLNSHPNFTSKAFACMGKKEGAEENHSLGKKSQRHTSIFFSLHYPKFFFCSSVNQIVKTRRFYDTFQLKRNSMEDH
jgi:hypothetical protein